MSLCSNCRENPAQYKVGSSVLCQPCLTLLDHAHNVSRLKHSRAPRVDLKAMQFFRRRIACDEFVGHLRTPSVIAALAAPRGKDTFFTRMRVGMRNLPHLFRGLFQTGRA